MAETYFTTDNTAGYSASELIELNEMFDFAINLDEPLAEDIRDSHEKNVASRVMAEFDAVWRI